MQIRSLSHRIVLSLAGAALLLGGCSTVPETGRRQVRLIDADQEMQLGLSEFQKLKTNTPISQDRTQQALLNGVGNNIARVAPLPNAQWEFVLFEEPENPNAFCLPGGKVGVYSGILPITQSEAGLATVIGHEVAHAVARHGAERVSHGLLIETGGQALDVLLGSSGQTTRTLALGAYGLGSQLGVALPYSRTQELEADHLGLLYMARAGYDPREAVAFWKRFSAYQASHGGGSSVEFLSTHPLDATRIRQLEQLLPKATQEYERYQASR